MKALKTIAAIFCLQLSGMLLATLATASDKPAFANDAQTLTGLGGVNIAVQLDGKSELDGLSEERLQTALELPLRSAGIRLLTKEEMSGRAEKPLLMLRVMTIEDKQAVSFSVTLTMHVAVKPKHGNLSEIVGAHIWERRAMGHGSPQSSLESITSNVKALADFFANDFLKANPKER